MLPTELFELGVLMFEPLAPLTVVLVLLVELVLVLVELVVVLLLVVLDVLLLEDPDESRPADPD